MSGRTMISSGMRVYMPFGMAAEFQEAIMDPEFKDLRLTCSCAFWAKDTVEMRYAGLKEEKRASHQREGDLGDEPALPGGPSATTGLPGQDNVRGDPQY